MLFKDLDIKQSIVRGLKEMGLNEPTDIQEKAIPLINQGRDVISISRTGSGKTAAFGIPILEKVVHGQGVKYLVIVPVRELAVQISSELKKFGKYVKFSVATVYGGVSINPQIEAIERADILVGTPGRLLDHLENYNLNLSKVDCVVLDEADKMVEMGFIEDIRRILSKTSKKKQVLLFGATISHEIEDLKRDYMHKPIVAQAESHVEEQYLEQYYYDIKHNEKFSLLVHLLKHEKKDLVIIFCSARSTVEMVTRNLRDNGIKADMIHGKLTQNRRLKTIENFHKGKPNILVASAVAARGLDIKDVSHIFNYDLSQDAQEYVHRVGRTARAGKSGKAITLLSERDHDVFREILSRYPLDVKQLPLEDFQRLRFNSSMRSRPRGRFGSRGFSGNSRGNQGYRSRSGGSRGNYGRPHPRGGRTSTHGQSKNFGNMGSSSGPRRHYGNRNNSGKSRSYGSRN